jgi:hypothetical protein
MDIPAAGEQYSVVKGPGGSADRMRAQIATQRARRAVCRAVAAIGTVGNLRRGLEAFEINQDVPGAVGAIVADAVVAWL